MAKKFDPFDDYLKKRKQAEEREEEERRRQEKQASTKENRASYTKTGSTAASSSGAIAKAGSRSGVYREGTTTASSAAQRAQQYVPSAEETRARNAYNDFLTSARTGSGRLSDNLDYMPGFRSQPSTGRAQRATDVAARAQDLAGALYDYGVASENAGVANDAYRLYRQAMDRSERAWREEEGKKLQAGTTKPTNRFDRAMGALRGAAERATGTDQFRQAGREYEMADFYAKMAAAAGETGNEGMYGYARGQYEQRAAAGADASRKGSAKYDQVRRQQSPAFYYGSSLTQAQIEGQLRMIDRDLEQNSQDRQNTMAALDQFGTFPDDNDPKVKAARKAATDADNRYQELLQQRAIFTSALRTRQTIDRRSSISEMTDSVTNNPNFDRLVLAGRQMYETQNQNANRQRDEYYAANDPDILADPYEGGYGFEARMKEYDRKAEEFGYVTDLDSPYLSEEQKAVYYALYATDRQKAEEYAKACALEGEEQHWAELAEEAGRNPGTRLRAFVEGTFANTMSGLRPFSDEGQYMNKYGSTLIGGGAKGLTEQGLFNSGLLAGEFDAPIIGKISLGSGYQLGSSMLQSGVNALVASSTGGLSGVTGALGTILLGSSAAASDYRERIEAGWDESAARQHAIAAGIAEAGFEYLSLDKLINQDAARGWLKNLLVQGGVEASEEISTTLANTLSDAYISERSGYDNSFEERAQELMAQGWSHDGARRQARLDWITEILNDGLGGFLSGGIMSGAPGAVKATVNTARNAAEVSKYSELAMVPQAYRDTAWSSAVQEQGGIQTAQRYDRMQEYLGGTAEKVLQTEGGIRAVRAFAEDNGIKVQAQEFRDIASGKSSGMRAYGKTVQTLVEKASDQMTKAGNLPGAEKVYTALVEKYGEGIRPVADMAMERAAATFTGDNTSSVTGTVQSAQTIGEETVLDEQARKAAQRGADFAVYDQMIRAQEAEQRKAGKDYLRNHGQEMTMQATVTSEDGSERKVGIESVDTEDGTVKLAGGETVSFDSLVADPDTKDVVHAMLASDMTEEASARMIRTFQAQTAEGMVTDAYQWAMDYVTSYDRGRVGSFSLEKAQQSVDVLHADTVKIAYEAGQAVSAQLTQEQREKLNKALTIREKGASGRAGSVDVGELAAKIEADEGLKAEVERIRKFAEVFGIDVGLFESGVKNGRYQGENGRYQDGKIWLDINAGRNKVGDVARGMVQTMAHEMTHFMQEYNPEDYAGVKRFVMQQIAAQKGENAIKQLVDEKKQRHTGSKPLSTTMAEDEIVADFCEDMLTDKTALETMAREDPKGFQALVQWIKDFMQKVFDKLAGRPAGSYEVQVYRSMEQSLRDAFGEAWGKGIVGAVQTHDVVGSIKNTAQEGGRQFSTRQEVLALENVDWMGDKTRLKIQLEKHRADIQKKFGGKPVIEIQYGGETEKLLAEMILKQALIAGTPNADRTSASFNRDGVTFEYNKAGIRHLKTHAGGDNALLAAAIISPYIAKDGLLISGHRNHEGYGYTTLTYAAPARINDRVVNVAVAIMFDDSGRPRAVAADTDGERFVIKNEEVPTRKRGRADPTAGSGDGTAHSVTSSIVTIPQNEIGVNPSAAKNSDRPSVDSSGRELSEGQQEYFKDSKILDKYGNLLTLYHGTASDFTVFDLGRSGKNYGGWSEYGSGIYLTPDKKFATYFSESASLRGGTPKLMELYANIKNPFNVNDPVTVDVSEYAKKYKLTEDDVEFLKKSGDRWLAFMREHNEDIYDFLTSHGYDGLWDAYGTRAPTQIVAFTENQVKNADNKTPTSNPDIRYSERDSFAVEMPVEAVRDLIAVHNMTEQNLRDVLELGGFPSPSIAIVKAANGHTNYGPISVVFSRDSIDPALDKRNKIYGADAWTPTAANAQVDTEVSYDVRHELDRKIYELSQKIAGGKFARSALFSGFLDDVTSMSREEILDRAARSEAALAAYLADRGETVEPVYKKNPVNTDRWGNRLLELINEVIRERGYEAQIYDLMNSGALVKANEELTGIVREALERQIEQNKHKVEPIRRNLQRRLDSLNDARVEELLLNAWAYQNEGQRTEQEFDHSATVEAMKQKIDPEHRIDGLMEDKVQNTVKAWLRPQIEGLLGKKGIRNERDRFTASGSERSFAALHDAYTLENIVKAMNRASARGTNTFGISANSLQSVTAPEYRSISQVRADKGRLARVDDDTYKRIKADLDSEIADLTDEIRSSGGGSGNYYIDADIIGDVLIAGARGGWSAASIQRLFARESEFTISTATANKIRKLYQKAANLPTEYFEAKPQRAMGFDEIEAVVLPSNMDHAIVQGLQDRGVSVLFFEPGNDAQRTEILNSLDDAKFQNRSYDAPSDMDLLDGFSQEDAANEEQRRLLREAQASGKKLREAQRQLERLRADMQALAGDKPSRITIKDFRRNVLDLFGIPSSERNGDIGNMIQSIAEGVLAGNKMSLEDISFFFQTFVENGTMRTVPNEYVSAIRDELKGRKIYVNDQVKEDLGEDYAALRKRSFGLGVTLTNNSKDMGIDQHWAELSEMYPGAFDSEELDLGTMLDQMISYAESGKASNVSILDGMRQVEEQTGEPVRDQLQRMYDSFVRHIEIMEDRGKLEAKARAGNAAEVANAKKQAAKAREELSKIRKERNEWKKKATSAEKKAADKLQAELRKIVRRDAAQLAEAVRQKEALAKKLQQQVEREQKILTGKLNTPQLAKMLKTARETAAKEMAKHKDEVFARAKDRRAISALMGRIRNLTAEIKRTATNPTDRSYMPAHLAGAMVDLLDLLEQAEVDTPKAGTKAAAKYYNTADAIRAMADEYKKLAKDPDYAFSSEFDEDVYDGIVQLAKQFERTSTDGHRFQITAKDMTLAELQQVYDTIRDIRNGLRNATRLIGMDEAISVYDFGRKIIQGQKTLRAIKEGKKGKKLRGWMNTIQIDALSPMRAAHMIDGYQDAEFYQLWQAIEEGQGDKNRVIMESNKRLQRFKTGKNELTYLRALRDKADFGVKDVDGKTVQMTKMQALQLLMTWQRETANDRLVHMQEGGVIIRDADLIARGKYDDATKTQQYVHVTPEMIAGIESKLTEWDRGYIEAARDVFTSLLEQSNKVLYALKHKVHKGEAMYIPEKVADNYLSQEVVKGGEFNLGVKEAGATKDLQQRSTLPIIIDGLETMLNRHINDMANYIGLALPIRNFAKVYNMRTTGTGIDATTVNQEIAKTWGGKAGDMMMETLRQVQNGRSYEYQTVMSNLERHIQSAFVKASLVGKISVFIKQAASYAAAGSVLSQKALDRSQQYILALVTKPNGKLARSIYERIDRLTPEHYMRRQGMSMEEIAMDKLSTGPLKDKIQRAGAWMESKGGVGKAARHLGQIVNPTNWIQRMDVATTGALVIACERQAKYDGYKRGTAEYDAHVRELYQQVIRQTQPMYDPLHRPALQKNAGALAKMAMPFRTVPFQNYGQIMDSFGNLQAAMRDGTKAEKVAAAKHIGKTVWANFESALVFAGLGALAYAIQHKPKRYTDDDEELTLESFLRTYGSDVLDVTLGNLLPYGGTELKDFVDRLINGDKWYDVMSVGSVDLINNTVKSIVNLVDESKKFTAGDASWESLKEQLYSTTLQMTTFFGIPASNVKDILSGARAGWDDWMNGRWLWLNDANIERSNTVNARRFIKAMEAGDTKKADSVMEEFRRNILKKKPGIKEDKLNQTIQNAITAYVKDLYMSDELDEATASSYLVEYGSAEDEDAAYWKIREWEAKAKHAGDDEYTFNKYEELRELVADGADITSEVKRLTDHGVKATSVNDDVKATIKDLFDAGKLSEDEVIEYLQRYHQTKDSKSKQYRPDTEDEAWETVQEWKAKQAHKGEEDYSWSKYEGLREAILSGGDVQDEVDLLVGHGSKEEDVYEDIGSTVKKMLSDGSITADKAEDLLLDYWKVKDKDTKEFRSPTENEVWAKVNAMEGAIEHADEEDYSYSQYDEIDAAIDANQDIKALVKDMTDHGVKKDNITSHVKGYLIDRYAAGGVTETALKNQLARYCGITAKDDVEKILKDANSKKSYGVAYSSLDEEYRAGHISRTDLVRALKQYGGLSDEDANKKVRWYDLQKKYPDMEITEAWSNHYYDGTSKTQENGHQSASAAGMTVKQYVDAMKILSKVTGTDADGNGKTDTNSKEIAYIAAIDAMNLTGAQKWALYYEVYKGANWKKIAKPNW